ncbi:response regulator transcription factor [Streptomyces sp. ISL-11]|uniref:response regulator n=1 Tax=Streptomyces sp. ISL-11 TaxID=2819174 RepID=UPI001BE5B54B|nr:response regulator transcription factor [Streptomyces sp. ISL-11]MBT2385859.1 response regulator transcription factor [Streptomyces sp. ISL-11]
MTAQTEDRPDIRVLVVDDQILIRAGVAALLRAAPGMEVVAEAADGEQAVALAAEHRPDVILMDIRMPGLSGIAATERILAAAPEDGPAPRVLVLTTFDLDEYVYAALRAGAAGFLLKDAGPQRLLAAVTAVAGGDTLFAPSVTRRLIEAFARRPAVTAGRSAGSLDALTGREREVLRLTARGLSNAGIAGELVISEATVKTHLNRAMAKLGLCSRAQAVVAAYESGLVTPGTGH